MHPFEAPIGAGEEYTLRAPTDAPIYDIRDSHDKSIVDWRLGYFMDMGFPALAAAALAVRRDVDREQVRRLLNGGATHRQVRAIVL